MSQESRGYPQRQERLPMQAEKITAEWLTRTLRNKYPGITIDNMTEIKRVTVDVMRVAISASGEGAADLPRQLCLKSVWGPNRSGIPANIIEAKFYRDLASRLEIPAVRCFYSDWDDDELGQQALLVLDDMGTWGGEFGTVTKPISVPAAMKAVEALAKLHGTTWGAPLLEEVSWLETAMAPETRMDDYWMLLEEHVNRINKMPERLSVLPPWVAKDPLKLREAWLQLRDQDMAVPGPRCLVHGDLHLGNTYRMTDGSCFLFDWQLPRKGHPWRDYGYFLIGAMTIEDRRASERQLLEHYLGELERYGISIPFDEAWDEYRRWVIWGLVAWHVAGDFNETEDTFTGTERFSVAATDLKVDQLYKL